MNEKISRTSRGIDPEQFGFWEGCRGEFFAAGCVCRFCGKNRADHRAAGLPAAEPQRAAQEALDAPAEIQIALRPIDGPCKIVITRCHGTGGPLDYDNLVGGLKALRDQITEKILGRQSDAEKDGIEWIYRQEPGRGCKVEIIQKTETAVNGAAQGLIQAADFIDSLPENELRHVPVKTLVRMISHQIRRMAEENNN